MPKLLVYLNSDTIINRKTEEMKWRQDSENQELYVIN